MTPAVPISAAFLERLRRRDPDALAEAVHDHAQPLIRAAKALGFAEQDAEDLVQDVFTTFLEKLETFEGRSRTIAHARSRRESRLLRVYPM